MQDFFKKITVIGISLFAALPVFSATSATAATLASPIASATMVSASSAKVVAQQATLPEAAGTVSFTIGEANLTDANANPSQAKPHPISRGEQVKAGQLIVTGANGHVHLRMIDGAFLSVRPSSRLMIEQYHVDTVNPGLSRIKFKLEQGVARSITGRAGEAAKEIYRLNTPLAAIGIRGTDFVVQAEQNITRVVVQSGAIVMSPLNADCLASSFGPCSTATTRVLTAAMHEAYLELRSKYEIPVLVPANVNSPNTVSPARPEEPRPGDKLSHVTTSDYSANASSIAVVASVKAKVETIKQTDPVKVPEIPKTPEVVVPPVEVPVVIPPVVEVPEVKPEVPVVIPVEVPVVQKFWWGRWSSYATTGSVLATSIAADGRETIASSSAMSLVRADGAMSLPQSGVVKFRLADSEAFLVGANNALTAAKIADPKLTVDFASRRYDTSLNVNVAGMSAIPITSLGSIDFLGMFRNESNSPNTQFEGALSVNGDQAGYLFERNLSSSSKVVGATRWIR